eukprot:TRINITY_DN22537_c0_g1_i2.p1 TRINITY_DN22537_c0_g1~~TRINITY_DN22537_c0_g1_i2.p1  ORF type:complete len:807 (+),score=201.67 TRINITY_DN22537_c0_g1_i2:55-2421(+)
MASAAPPHPQVEAEVHEQRCCCADPQKGNWPPKRAAPSGCGVLSCLDCFCILVFILFLAGWVVIGVVALQKGEPRRLLLPADFRGELCGDTGPRDAYPYLFIPEPEFKLTYGICVKECPRPGAIVCNNDDGPADSEGAVRNNKEFEMSFEEVGEVNRLARPDGVNPFGDPPKQPGVGSAAAAWPILRIPLTPAITTCRTLNVSCSLGGGTADDADDAPAESAPLPPCDCGKLLDKAANAEARLDSFNCFPTRYWTSALLHRCMPVVDAETSLNKTVSTVLKHVSSALTAGHYFTTGFAEVEATWRLILLSGVTAALITLVLLYLMRCCLALLVYLTLLLVLALLIVAGIACHIYANKLEDKVMPGDTTHEQQVQTFRAFSYLFFAAACVYFAVMIWLCSRVRIAIQVLKEASRAVLSSPSVLLAPVVTFALLGAGFCWFLYLAVYIETSEGLTSADLASTLVDNPVITEVNSLCKDDGCLNLTDARENFTTIEGDDLIRYLHLYNLFGFLWVANLLMAFGFFTVATVGVMWFGSDPSDDKRTPPCAVLHGLCRACRRIGTLIFGSLLIATIQTLRAVMLYIEKQLPEDAKSNEAFCLIRCCVHCFLACLERVIKIITRLAYVVTAMHEWGFCASATEVVALLSSNPLRAAVLLSLTGVVLFVVKLLACGLNIYFVMTMMKDPSQLTSGEDIESGLFPLFFVLVLSYVVVSMVLTCYETMVDTIFICALEAEKCQTSAYVPSSLRSLLSTAETIGQQEEQLKRMRQMRPVKRDTALEPADSPGIELGPH